MQTSPGGHVINLLDLDAAGLAAFFADRGEKPFRAKQVSRWVHQRLVDGPDAMTDLSRGLRDALAKSPRSAARR